MFGNRKEMEMEEAKSDDRLFGNLALALVIAGLLVPFAIAIVANARIAMGFGVVAILLALLFGIVGWKQKTGKVTVLVIGCLGVLAIIAGVIFFLRRSEARSVMEARAHQEQRAKEKQAEQSAAPLPRDPQTGHSEGAR